MEKLFVDTDIAYDVITGRKPFSDYASILFSWADFRQVQLFVSSISFTNLYYTLRKIYGHQEVIDQLKNLDKTTHTISVDEKIIRSALDSKFRDFEDAVQYYCASKIIGVKAIITRNIKDYKLSAIPIMTAESYVKSKNRSPKS